MAWRDLAARLRHRERMQTEHGAHREQAPGEPLGWLYNFSCSGTALEGGKHRCSGRRRTCSLGQKLGCFRIQNIGANVAHLQADQQDDQADEEELIAIQVHDNADSREEVSRHARAAV